MPGGQVLRGLDEHLDIQVALRVALAHAGHALAAQAQLAAGLGALGNGDAGAPAIDGRDLDLAAERSGRHRHRRAAIEVRPVALEDVMLDDFDEDIEVALRAAGGAGLALAGQADAHAAFDTGRDLDRDLALFLHLAVAAAGLARLADDSAATLADMAGALHREETLLGAHAAMAAAGLAGFRLGAGGGAGRVARFARHGLGHVDGFVLAEIGFGERDLEIVAQVGAALRAPALAAIGKAAGAAEHLAEQVLENVFGIDALAERAAARAAAAILEGGMAEPVIGGAFLRVRQHGIGFADFLELLFGGLVAGILVRVEFHRQLAIGRFKGLLVGPTLHT